MTSTWIKPKIETREDAALALLARLIYWWDQEDGISGGHPVVGPIVSEARRLQAGRIKVFDRITVPKSQEGRLGETLYKRPMA